MKAIMIQGNDLFDILTGLRKMDYRIWEPRDRKERKGRILLCSAAKKYKGYACGYALATAEIGKIERYPGDALDGGDLFGWELKKIRFVEPFEIRQRARQSFFEVEDKMVRELKGMKLRDWAETYYDVLRTW